MIEKLKWIESDTQLAYIANEKALEHKINELVDAVNELQNIQVQVNGHEFEIASIYDRLNGFRAVMRKNGWNVDWTYPEHIADVSKMIDPYAEQRKWIGKACWFWDEKEEEKVFGILTTIDSDCGLSDMCPYWNDSTKNWFEYCEPVSPDDDIIYKKVQQ